MMQVAKDVRIDCKATIQACKKFIFTIMYAQNKKNPFRIIYNKRMTKQVETL